MIMKNLLLAAPLAASTVANCHVWSIPALPAGSASEQVCQIRIVSPGRQQINPAGARLIQVMVGVTGGVTGGWIASQSKAAGAEAL